MTAFYCFVLFLSLGFWQEPNTAPFKIAISTDKTTVVSGADVVVDVSLTNNSNRDVEEGVMYKQGISLDSTFRFEVRDDRGKLVPKRSYPHEELRPGNVNFRTIRAGQALTQAQPVSALYDMRKPGKYTIQVWRRNPDYEIKSNIVTVTVTTKDKDPARASRKVH
jgi:hypothetical protein